MPEYRSSVGPRHGRPPVAGHGRWQAPADHVPPPLGSYPQPHPVRRPAQPSPRHPAVRNLVPRPAPATAEVPFPPSSVAARRCPIATVARSVSTTTAQALQFAEAYVAEDLVLRTARSLAREVGLDSVTPGTGATLRLLAAAGSARAVVEIGTGTGVSGLWLLRGMRADGILTTIDVETEHQRIARRIFQEAGFASGRTRIITGRALDVLPRLADGVYDLLFVDSDIAEYSACVDAALRLLRPGGVLALHGALAAGRIGDPAARDMETVTVREVVKAVRESDEWTPALLPTGEGLLVAVKR